MSNFPSEYFTTGLYTNPATNLVVQSGKGCGSRIELPCAFRKDTTVETFNTPDSLCIIKWCKLYKAIVSIAGSSLLEANAATTMGLDAAQIACAKNNAELILECA